jgi:hypothetical protein
MQSFERKKQPFFFYWSCQKFPASLDGNVGPIFAKKYIFLKRKKEKNKAWIYKNSYGNLTTKVQNNKMVLRKEQLVRGL